MFTEFVVDEIEKEVNAHTAKSNMTELQKMEIRRAIWKDSYNIAMDKLINAHKLIEKQRQDIEKLERINKNFSEANKIYFEALELISSYSKNEDGICPYGCDTPSIAKTALGK